MPYPMHRREFIATGSLAVGGLIARAHGQPAPSAPVPSFLSDVASAYRRNPRQAHLDWFRQARFGLFIHYGLYSLLEGEWQGQESRPAEWIQLRCQIPVPEYARLAREFRAERFDADFITDLALEAGMKYINITTRHHDSFCLWDTATPTSSRRTLQQSATSWVS